MIHDPIAIPSNMRVYSGMKRFVGVAPKGMINDRLISKANDRLKVKSETEAKNKKQSDDRLKARGSVPVAKKSEPAPVDAQPSGGNPDTGQQGLKPNKK